MGKVYSTKRNIIMEAFPDKRGYVKVALYDSHFDSDNKVKHFFVHRLVAEAFIPNPEDKPTVNHIDGNKENCNDWNLEWATYGENILHAWQTGLANNQYTKNKLAI